MLQVEKAMGALNLVKIDKTRNTLSGRNSALVIFLTAFFIALSTAQCTQSANIPEGYQIVCARDFSVAEYARANAGGRILYELDKAGGYIITSVAYDLKKNIVAIAVGSKEPQKESATIKLLDRDTLSILKEIHTKKDYIRGMTLDSVGKIAFVANDMYLDRYGEICYLSIADGTVKSVAKGRHFRTPSWSKDSQRIYFSYIQDSHRGIAFVDINKPDIIGEISAGLSVSVSDSGKIAYLANDGEVILMPESAIVSSVSKLRLKHVDPKFTDSIRFVKGDDCIILQQYKKSVVYDLVVLQPPYENETMMLPHVGMKDFDVALVKAK